MAKGRRNERYMGLDLGTEGVRVVLAERTENGLDVVGVGKARSNGLQRGTVINIDSTVSAIQAAVEEAVLMGGNEVSVILCSISGSHVSGFNSPGVVTVRNSEVREDDVVRVLRQAQTVRLAPGREIFHVLPIEFAVDENDGIKGPVGMSGVRLEARVHMVTAAKAAMDNIKTCCQRVDLNVSNLVFSALASSEVVLHEDEKELGVILADIGAGTTDLAVWYNGSVIQTAVIPVGGGVMTNDIATGLRTPRKEAEILKMEHGCALSGKVGEHETIEVPSVGGREPTIHKRSVLASFIEPRAEEIFTQIAEVIRRAGNEEYVSSGLVITGGTSKIPGMAELGTDILGKGVRVGSMLDLTSEVGGVTSAIQDDSYSVALGMVLMAYRGSIHPVLDNGGGRRVPEAKPHLIRRVGQWFKDSFGN